MPAKSLIVPLAILCGVASAGAAETWQVEVRETAGIQRFKYPVSAEFTAGASAADATFELSDGGKAVEAQFTRLAGAGPDQSDLWSVDWHIDLLPQETRALTIARSAGGQPTPRRPGLSVERAGGKILVRHPTLEFALAEDLSGLLAAIRVSGDDWLAGGPSGLAIKLRDGREFPFKAGTGSDPQPQCCVIKQGPLAVRLEFIGAHELTTDSAVQSRVVLDFPLGKSWVRVDWTLVDPADAVARQTADFRLRLDSDARTPVLADVGANGWTYATLRSEERLIYRATPAPAAGRANAAPWRIDRVLGDQIMPFARPSDSAAANLSPQGWAHLMDRKRVTAIGVDRFAEKSTDEIDLSADGAVHLRRDFPPRERGQTAAEKRLTFWLHVVSFPPQVGAATSPQSMLAPPEVRIRGAVDSVEGGKRSGGASPSPRPSPKGEGDEAPSPRRSPSEGDGKDP